MFIKGNILIEKVGEIMERIVKEKQDFRFLLWAKIRNSSGTAGSFLKAYSDLDGKKTYYKLSNFDSYKGIVGHECVNEIIVDRLLSILGIEHLSYKLIHADVLIADGIYDTYLCASEDFKEQKESKIALEAYYQAECEVGEEPLAFCIRSGWEDYIYKMLVVDFLILNRDRHGANIEVLRNSAKKTVRLAPLFDHGLSLIFQCQDDEDINNFDVMEDKKVQCFVGGNSAMKNLELIPKNKMPKLNNLKEDDRTVLFEGLEEILPALWRDKIWEMIWKRWCYYEDFCNQR